MRLQYLELNGFKSFSKKTSLEFNHSVVSIVGPNGSGKSNVVEAFRFVLGEQSMKSMRGRGGVDLIFKGSKSLPKGSKASVAIYFDNTDRIFKLPDDSGESIGLDFDTISISREVYSDGMNKYLLNGSEVRLKDINNLLASVNIGSSGHHIISQGEADRILNASAKDKKEMIEDALGLKVYQYKIKEAERKLERSNENMKEVSVLRRENAPHLSFLRRQVEKIEKLKELRLELVVLYKEYLKKESVYLENEKSTLSAEKGLLSGELDILKESIAENNEDGEEAENKKLEELKNIEEKAGNIRRLRGEMERKLGRIEGMLEAEKWRAEKAPEVKVFKEEEVKQVILEIDTAINQALDKENIAEVRAILENIKNILNKLNEVEEGRGVTTSLEDIQKLENTRQEILEEIVKLSEEESKIVESVDSIKREIKDQMDAGRDKEREKFALRVKHQEVSSALSLNSVKQESLNRSIESFDFEIKEGIALVGEEVLLYKDFEVAESSLDRGAQDELKRKIERIKIKLEDGGLGNGHEVLKEFEETTARDEFLAREMEDLATSISALEELITNLKEKISIEFKDGIKKINVAFAEFFSLMFGGGKGELTIVLESKKKRKDKDEEYAEDVETIEDDAIPEEGIEIDVSLPHKKVKELHSLSGGERSLTSIALLFAMSSVNPPPFLILDETDAALDEANSRKYGDMVQKLSTRSQLIVVTHNRETMSRANILYGVTIGSDGSSKLLSVKFEEAQAIAK